MTEPASDRLSPLETAMLGSETPDRPADICVVLTYDGPIERDALIEALRSCLPHAPRLRQRLSESPSGVARPEWVEVPDLDVADHVVELTLSPPGDRQTVSRVGGSAITGMLARDRPLWKMVLIQGAGDGASRLIWRIHHAVGDGVTLLHLLQAIHGERTARPTSTPLARAVPPAERLARDLRDQGWEWGRRIAEETLRWMRPDESLRRLQQMQAAARSMSQTMTTPAPPTPFNGPLSPRRTFVWTDFSLAAIRRLRHATGGTVNDVVFSVVAGGLRSHLLESGLPPRDALRVYCPVSMRADANRPATGNQVSAVIAPLHVEIADPVERLYKTIRAFETLKRDDVARGLYEWQRLYDFAPAFAQNLQLSGPPRVSNTMISNVPGSTTPLALCGRRAIHMFALAPLTSDIGLAHALLSSGDVLSLGISIDPERLADPWCYVEQIERAFAALSKALLRSGEPGSTSRQAVHAADGPVRKDDASDRTP